MVRAVSVGPAAATTPAGLGFLDSCWLVCEGRRLGPLPYDRALEELQALHARGVPLARLTIVGAPLRAAAGRTSGAGAGRRGGPAHPRQAGG